jgi:hypothetical protein
MVLKDNARDEVELRIDIEGQLVWNGFNQPYLVFNRQQVETLRDYLTSLLDNDEVKPA